MATSGIQKEEQSYRRMELNVAASPRAPFNSVRNSSTRNSRKNNTCEQRRSLTTNPDASTLPPFAGSKSL